MDNVRVLRYDWYTGRPGYGSAGEYLARQYNHLSDMVVLAHAPKLNNYYLIVTMKETESGDVKTLEPIQLSGSFWLIPNIYTQLAQEISFQFCCKTESGDFESHSAEIRGRILPSKDHHGASIDVDPSIMYDPYKRWVEEIAMAAGAIIIDSELSDSSTNPVQNRVVKAAIDGLVDDIDAVNGRLRQQQEIIAEAFSTQSTYDVGDYVTYDDSLYKCHTAITTAGAWDSIKWTEVKVTDEMKLAEGAIPYPTDSQGGKVFPQSDKIVKVKNDGTTEYEDIPVGDVKKNLLFDSQAEDPTKTTVALTINTAGEASHDEVQNLKNTIVTLVGDGSLEQVGYGGIKVRNDTSLGYQTGGYTALLPVIPGHEYRFLWRDGVKQYSAQQMMASPGFDFDYKTRFSPIPNTSGSRSLGDSDYTDGNQFMWNGTNRVIVPAGMNYLVFGLAGEIVYDETAADKLGPFKVYDYTEYPVNATYEQIVDEPISGNTFSITYTLQGATSSNNASQIGTGNTYHTTITAETGKVISDCSVQIGGTTYRPTDGVLTINGAASNIAITTVAELPSDSTYVGQYTIKEDLIPSNLLDAKIDKPTGFSSAAAGRLLYTDGNGGLVVSAPKETMNLLDHDLDYVSVYGNWKPGYYYDTNSECVIATGKTIWGSDLYTTAICTPPDNMIPCKEGEKWRFILTYLRDDSTATMMPSVHIFDANKNVLLSVRTYEGLQPGEWYYMTMPEGAAWLAINGRSGMASTNFMQRLGIPLYTKSYVKNLIRATWNAIKRTPSPVLNTLDKGYICMGTDDLRGGETWPLHKMYTDQNIPYYIAAIPTAMKNTIPLADGVLGTNMDVCRMCVEAGGELMVHNPDPIVASNIDDYDTLYKYFIESKNELEAYGFDIRGIILAGGSGVIRSDERINKWAETFYEYSDAFGYAYPFWSLRLGLQYCSTNDIDRVVEEVCVNHGYKLCYTHTAEQAAVDNFNYLMTKLGDYQRGVDYDFCTPSQLYDMLMPEHQ